MHESPARAGLLRRPEAPAAELADSVDGGRALW